MTSSLLKYKSNGTFLIPVNHDAMRLTDIKRNGEVLLIEKKPTRSLKQNAYLHKVFSILSDETGYTIEQIKHEVCIAVGHSETFANKNTGEEKVIRRKTSDLNTSDFSDLTQRILQWCAEQGYYIQTPQEYFET
jgi:hypothetical protein